MIIKILQFKVIERYVHQEGKLRKLLMWLAGMSAPIRYHFDVVMRIDRKYEIYGRLIEPNDVLQLPNKTRVKVWQIDKDLIWAKTIEMIQDNLRNYKPIEVYLLHQKITQLVIE